MLASFKACGEHKNQKSIYIGKTVQGVRTTCREELSRKNIFLAKSCVFVKK
jgi:hypothetical protein